MKVSGGSLTVEIISKIIMLTKAGLNLAGIDLIRLDNRPKHSLLGLKSKPFHTIIDVGANTGQFARYISDFFPNARLFCFEPLPEPFKALEAWSNTQNGRVTPFNVAVGDEEEESEMFLHKEHTPSSSLLATTSVTELCYPLTKEQQRITIKQTRLDTVLGQALQGLTPDILIKLDVQGYENRVIAGGPAVFAQATACILEVNVDTLYEGQASFVELIKMLDALGYRYVGNLDQSYGKDGHCIFFEAVFLRTHETEKVKS
jgi:FkbM family methyltransferase